MVIASKSFLNRIFHDISGSNGFNKILVQSQIDSVMVMLDCQKYKANGVCDDGNEGGDVGGGNSYWCKSSLIILESWSSDGGCGFVPRRSITVMQGCQKPNLLLPASHQDLLLGSPPHHHHIMLEYFEYSDILQ